MKGEGPTPATSLWVGLGPGEEEIRTGRVWVGPAGRLLNSLLVRNGIFREDMFITNLRRTPIQPGDGGPYTEIGHLEYEMFKASPYLIVTMGREAAQLFLGDVDLEAVHGIAWRAPDSRWRRFSHLGPPPTILPMYNPAFALHDDEAYTLVAYDISQARRAMDGAVEVRPIKDQFPNPEYRLGFRPYPHRRVFVDTEGFPWAPFCLSYTCIPGTARVILATDVKGLREFQEWLDGRDEVWMHSAMYDLAVLRAMHIFVRDDQIGDTKVLAFETQVEPQGLKALGFRRACMRMKSYDEVTSPYDFVQAFEYLERVAEVDWGKPEPSLEYRGGKPYVKNPQSLNTRVRSIFTAIAKDEAEEDEASGVNPRRRWFKIDPEVRLPAERELGPMPDFTMGIMPIDEVVEYSGRDVDATCRILNPLLGLVRDGGHMPVYRTDIEALPMVERMQANGLAVQPGYFEKLAGFFDREMSKIRKQIESYNAGAYINPGSSQQTAKLLFDRLRLPITKLTKGRKPSTADKVLEALRGRHPAVGLICDWRELATLKDKFAKQLPAFVDEDGRVRGNIRDTTVVSGRYSMSEPNLMAIPVRTKVGKKIREGFIAGPGRLLGTADFDQVEMRVMADLSQDEFMLGAFHEGRDIHSENARDIFEVRLEEVDTPEGKILYRYPAKRIGFGIITGITEMGLYDQMRLAGIHKYSVADCAGMISRFFKVRPGIARFISATRADAVRDGYVRDKGGRIRYLPGVYSHHPAVREEALRQSHSHRISGTAQWIKKRAMARIWKDIRDLPRWEVEPLLEIHDEFLMEFKVDREAWVGAMMMKHMSADSNLFSVPIKAKFTSGPNWGVLKD